MKCPSEIYWYPLDVKKDDETKGLWFYIPEWIVRGFKLKAGSNYGKVEILIKKDNRCINDYMYKEQLAKQYYKENWNKKMCRAVKGRWKKQKNNM